MKDIIFTICALAVSVTLAVTFSVLWWACVIVLAPCLLYFVSAELSLWGYNFSPHSGPMDPETFHPEIVQADISKLRECHNYHVGDLYVAVPDGWLPCDKPYACLLPENPKPKYGGYTYAVRNEASGETVLFNDMRFDFSFDGGHPVGLVFIGVVLRSYLDHFGDDLLMSAAIDIIHENMIKEGKSSIV